MLNHLLWSVLPKAHLYQATGLYLQLSKLQSWYESHPQDLNTRGLMVVLPAFHSSSVICPAQGSPPPFLRMNSSYLLVSLSSRKAYTSHNCIVCQTSYISEPVGGSAPKFSEKSSGFVLTEKSAHPFSLACPAQGSPTPAFRSVRQKISFSRSPYQMHGS